MEQAIELVVVTTVVLATCYSVYCVGVAASLYFDNPQSKPFDKDDVRYTDGDNT